MQPYKNTATTPAPQYNKLMSHSIGKSSNDASAKLSWHANNPTW